MPKKAFEDNATSITQTFKWYSCFKSGWTLFEGLEPSDDPSSRQTDESLEKMHKIIHEDRRLRLTKFVTFHAFCLKIETWNEFLKNLCPMCWMTAGNKTKFLLGSTCKIKT